MSEQSLAEICDHLIVENEKLRAEVERLSTALGQANADLFGCRDGALLRDLRSEIAQLTHELAVIGDMAVTDWNDPVVGVVNRAIGTEAPTNYVAWRKAELAQHEAMRAEIAQLKAQLGDAKQDAIDNYTQGKKWGLARAVSVTQEYIRIHSYPSAGEIRDIIRAEITKMEGRG